MRLATLGSAPVKKGEEALRLWKWCLRAHSRPMVYVVGTGLPDALRTQGGATEAIVFTAAAALGRMLTVGTLAVAVPIGISHAAGGPQTQTGTTESGTLDLRGAGPSTAALRAAPSSSAAAGPSSTRAAKTFEAEPRDSGATGPSAST